MKIITIDREYGSGGREVGKLIAGKAGIPCYDKELLTETAKNYSIDFGTLQSYDEMSTGSLLYNIATAVSGMRAGSDFAKPYEIFRMISDTVKRLAGNGPCVFIGRCANNILKEKYDVLSVFLYASSIEDKKKRARMIDRIEEKRVANYMEQKDRQRKAYYETFTKRKWGDRNNYDIMLNTSGLSYESCADVILSLA